MLQLIRTNAWTYLQGVTPALEAALQWNLSVELEDPEKVKIGLRYSRVWQYGRKVYGTLYHPAGEQPARVPSGLVAHAAATALQLGIQYTIVDKRHRPQDGYPLHTVKMPWRPYQDAIHDLVIRQGHGVIVVPPRGGKTSIAARAIDAFGINTVYVAPSVAIVQQTYEVFCNHFGSEWVGRIDGEATAKERADKLIMVCTAQSAVAQSEAWWRSREMLIIDESHHAAAETYHQISVLAGHIFHRFFLTGTHFRSRGDDLAMHAIAGATLAQVSVKQLVEQGYLATPRMFYLNYQAPRVTGTRRDFKRLYQQAIVSGEYRNRLVVQLAKDLMSRGDQVIVLTQRRMHADALGEAIPESAVAKGNEGALTSQTVRSFLAGRFGCLVGTTVIGEGVDVPKASALIYATAGAGGVRQIQSYFRPLTAAPGKTYGRIYDFVDRQHELLLEHSAKRIETACAHLGSEYVQVA